MKNIAAPIALFLVLTAIAPFPRSRPRPVRLPAGSPVVSWTKYCGDLGLNGTPAGVSRINAVTMPRMALAWRTKLNGPIASAPSVSRGIVYVGDWSGNETALDASNGTVVASANLGTTHAPQCDPSTLGVTSSPAIEDNAIYLAGGDSSFYALNRETLDVIWKQSMGDNSALGGYYGWSSPAVVGNRVIQGVSSNCDNPFVPGRLVAMNRTNGEEVASAQFVPDGELGNGVWTSPAVDVPHRKIFVTTASGNDYNDGLGYSIVRLDLDTLAVEDSWKVTIDGEMWDADWGSSPTLFTDRAGRQLVGAGHKDGHYYAFRRTSLASGPVWSAQIAVRGEVPQAGDGTLSTAAFDGARLYVGGGVPPNAGPEVNGSVVALDPATGKILWRQGLPGTVIAPVSTVNGVVFAGGGNLVAAFEASNGRMLWSYRTDAPLYGGIAIAGDTIYVGDLSGTLYAFRVM